MAALNAFAHAFWEMPPITRTYVTASVLTTFLVQLELISPFQIYFNPKLIFGSYQVSSFKAPKDPIQTDGLASICKAND